MSSASNALLFEKTISIDTENAIKLDQAYSYDKDTNEIWIHIIVPDCNNNTRRRFNSSNNNNYQRNYFINDKGLNNNVKNKCVSLKIISNQARDLNEIIKTSNVILKYVLNFRESELILNDINDKKYQELTEWQHLNESIKKFHELGRALRESRLGSKIPEVNEKNTEVIYSMKHVIAEFSIYANSILSEYLWNIGQKDFSFMQLCINPLEESHRENIRNFVYDNMDTNFVLSKYLKEKLFIFHERNALDDEQFEELKNKTIKDKNVRIIEPAFKFISVFLKGMLDALDKDRFKLTRGYYDELKRLTLLEAIYPEFVFYIKKYLKSKSEPDQAKLKFYEKGFIDAKKNYNFHCNKNYYNYDLTRPSNNVKSNVSYISIIHDTLNRFDQNLKFHLDNLKELKNKLTDSRIIHKNFYKKKEENKEGFENQIVHFSIVAENIIDNNKEKILKLRFPIVLSYYDVPVNKALNLSSIFEPFRTDIVDSYEIKIFITNNQSNDHTINQIELSRDDYVNSISIQEFKALNKSENNDIIDVTVLKDLYKKMEMEIGEKKDNENENKFTLNTQIILKFNFEKYLNDGLVLPVEFCVNKDKKLFDNIYDHNKYNDDDYKEFYPDESEPPDNKKAHIQLIKLNCFIHFCVEHHPLLKNNEIWQIRNVKLLLDENNNILSVLIKKTEWANKFKKLENVCLRISKNINKSKEFSEYEQMIIDDDYVCVYHGKIEKYDPDRNLEFKLNERDFQRFNLEKFNLDKENFIIELY